MFLSKLGYSELIQRLFEKMAFFLVDPLDAGTGADNTSLTIAPSNAPTMRAPSMIPTTSKPTAACIISTQTCIIGGATPCCTGTTFVKQGKRNICKLG